MVNPKNVYNNVFVFRIANGMIAHNDNVYEATRKSWRVTQKYRDVEIAYGVGLIGGMSMGSYEILNWEADITDVTRYIFASPNHPHPNIIQELNNEDWSNVLAPAMGFWMRGNYLIVNFNGEGKFSIIRRAGPNNRVPFKCIN